METYFGYIKTPHDALIVFEACRRNQLPSIKRRLCTEERDAIGSGSVFVWDEMEAGMRRWTDGRAWSPSRVFGSFLVYREKAIKNGLIKQSFSLCTATHQRLHLISYYLKSDIDSLQRPSKNPRLSHISIPRGYYPELNPLDTGGGHLATWHNLQEVYSVPSLSSSPNTLADDDDDDISFYSPVPRDIPYEKLPFTEDQRQLSALYTVLRL